MRPRWKKVPFHLSNQMKKKRLRCAQHNRIARKQFVHGQAAHTNSFTNYTAITSLLIKSFYSREERGSVWPLRAISHTTATEAAEWGVRNEITFSCTKATPIWSPPSARGRGRSDIKRERKMKKWRLELEVGVELEWSRSDEQPWLCAADAEHTHT